MSSDRRRGLLVITGVDGGGKREHDYVVLYADGLPLSTDDVADHVMVALKIPDTHMPKGACRAVAFRDVPEGSTRIHVRPARGAERYYSVTIGTGYRIPWHVSWRFRGCEAYWCGD